MRLLMTAVTMVGLAAWAWSAWGAEAEARWPEWRTRAAHFFNRAAREVQVEVDRRAQDLIDSLEPSPLPPTLPQSV